MIEGEAINGFGDSDLGLKYGLTSASSKIQIAATLTFGLPLGETAGGTQRNLQTGDGEFNQILQFDASTSFSIGDNATIYGTSTIGFNNRSNGFSDEFRYGYEIGLGLFDSKLWLVGKLTGVESFRNGSLSGEINSTSIFANNSEHTSITAEVAYYITPKFGLAVSYASAFRGEIIFADPSYSVGVFVDLK